MDGAMKPMMIRGMQKFRKLPKMLLKVAPMRTMTGRLVICAMAPTTIPRTMAITILGSRPNFFLFILSLLSASGERLSFYFYIITGSGRCVRSVHKGVAPVPERLLDLADMVDVPGLQDHGHNAGVDVRVLVVPDVVHADNIGSAVGDHLQKLDEAAGFVRHLGGDLRQGAATVVAPAPSATVFCPSIRARMAAQISSSETVTISST